MESLTAKVDDSAAMTEVVNEDTSDDRMAVALDNQLSARSCR